MREKILNTSKEAETSNNDILNANFHFTNAASALVRNNIAKSVGD